MIVPMKKISLIIMGDQIEKTLKKLRKLGLMHIEITEGKGEKLPRLREQISMLESGIFLLGDKADKSTRQREATAEEALAVAERVPTLNEESRARQAELAALTAEAERLADWGDIDPEAFAALAEKGVSFTLCELPMSEYRRLGDSVTTLLLAEGRANARFLLLNDGRVPSEEDRERLRSAAVEMPRASTKELRRRIDDCRARIEEIEGELASLSAYLDAMRRAVKTVEAEIRFETYRTGMAEEDLASSGREGFTVSYFTGYIEAENTDTLRAAAKENAWGFIAEDPSEDDPVPTKLKNNKFVSLIYPLTDFLGTVPGYFEFDISAWFLTFILIFFGIIFGDGGYGLLICGVVAVPILKALFSGKKIQPAFLLIGLFGVATIIWGTLTCTWFGISPSLLPAWLRRLSVPVISNVYADKLWCPPWTNEGVGLTTSQNVQILCFTLALVQLTVAHIMGAVRNRRSIKLLGDIGSAFQLIGIYYVVLMLVVSSEVFTLDLTVGGIPVGLSAVCLIGLGFVMSFVFSNYEGSIGGSVLSSLKDIVSVLLGVINVFSDIVSYIRLWAVGLAGAAISATVNELVSPFFGKFLFMIFAVILLVFGHGLNMILNVLSVIVHGIRLNTLEFSSHLNMSWSGHKYEPFKEQID